MLTQQNIETLVNEINTNKGFTFDLRTRKLVGAADGPRYGVSLEGGWRGWAIPSRSIVQDISRFVAAKECELLAPSHYLGAWVGNDGTFTDGTLYLDVTMRVDNLADALALGRANKQIAIWDFQTTTFLFTAIENS